MTQPLCLAEFSRFIETPLALLSVLAATFVLLRAFQATPLRGLEQLAIPFPPRSPSSAVRFGSYLRTPCGRSKQRPYVSWNNCRYLFHRGRPALLSVLATTSVLPTVVRLWAKKARRPLRINNVYVNGIMIFAHGREHAALPMALSPHMPPRCTTRTATDISPHCEATGGRTAEGRMRPSTHNDAHNSGTTTHGAYKKGRSL